MSTEFTSVTGDQKAGQQQPQQLSETDIFERLRSYPFQTDSEFAKGLSIILKHPETPASDAEICRDDDLVLQAKCFYFSKKEKLASPLNFAAYRSWLESKQTLNPPVENQAQEDHISTTSTSPSSGGTPNAPPKEQPTYPTSFSHIVELITTGQPIPGIQEIPDTVLAGQDAPSTKERRRKPWEKGESS